MRLHIFTNGAMQVERISSRTTYSHKLKELIIEAAESMRTQGKDTYKYVKICEAHETQEKEPNNIYI